MIFVIVFGIGALVALGVLAIGTHVLNRSVLLHGPVYVPSDASRISIMLRLARIKPKDAVIDLGSGDGSIVLAAAKLFPTVSIFGLELNPILVLLSRLRLQWELQKDQLAHVHIMQGNLWGHEVRKYNVVFLYAAQSIMPLLEQKILREMKPGSRIISHAFQFPTLVPVGSFKNVYVYVL